MSTHFARLAAVCVLFNLMPPLKAQEDADNHTAKGQIKVVEHRFKLRGEQPYLVKVQADFRPRIMVNGRLLYPSRETDGKFLATFISEKTEDHRVAILPGGPDLKEPEPQTESLNYQVDLTPLTRVGKPVLDVEEKLPDTEPKTGRTFKKDFAVRLTGKQAYFFELTCAKKSLPRMDARDSDGKPVSPTGLNRNQLYFSAPTDGDYLLTVRLTGADPSVSIKGHAVTTGRKKAE